MQALQSSLPRGAEGSHVRRPLSPEEGGGGGGPSLGPAAGPQLGEGGGKDERHLRAQEGEGGLGS